MTIYSLMNKVPTLLRRVALARNAYSSHDPVYASFEDEAIASLDTLLDVGYIDDDEHSLLWQELYHVFRMYKRH